VYCRCTCSCRAPLPRGPPCTLGPGMAQSTRGLILPCAAVQRQGRCMRGLPPAQAATPPSHADRLASSCHVSPCRTPCLQALSFVVQSNASAVYFKGRFQASGRHTTSLRRRDKSPEPSCLTPPLRRHCARHSASALFAPLVQHNNNSRPCLPSPALQRNYKNTTTTAARACLPLHCTPQDPLTYVTLPLQVCSPLSLLHAHALPVKHTHTA
jgi:hypothetical protein